MFKMKLTTAFLALLILISFSVFSSNEKVIKVGPEGSGYSSILEALEMAEDGDTLFIHEGTYDISGVVITKSVKLKGEGQKKVVFKEDVNDFIKISSVPNGKVEISGITILSKGIGLMIVGFQEGMSNVYLSDMTIVSDDVGIRIFGYGNSIENCRIKSKTHPIEIRWSAHSDMSNYSRSIVNKIVNCYFEAHKNHNEIRGSGISLIGSGQVYLKDNEYVDIFMEVTINGFWLFLSESYMNLN